jgi:hypothetical protein
VLAVSLNTAPNIIKLRKNEQLILPTKLGRLTLPSPKEGSKKSEVKVLSFGEDLGEAKLLGCP